MHTAKTVEPALRPCSRSDFLTRTSVLFSAAALANYCGTGVERRQLGAAGHDPLENALARGLQDRPILVALNAGITAPNPHNTQAWKFRLVGDAGDTALLYVDESRLLPVTDPTHRQIHIGQGCLLETTALAAARLGYACRIDLFPEGRNYRVPQSIGRQPVARIQLIRSASLQLDPLAGAIAARHTVRSAYMGPLLTPDELESVITLACPAGSRVQPVLGADALRAHLDRHFAGFEREVLTRRTAEESRQWFRIGEREIFSKRDGISLRDNGIGSFERWLLETFFLSKEPEVYFAEENTHRFLARYRENLNTARAGVIVIAPANRPADWIQSGRDYVRLQLAATRLGFVSRPMSQLLQEFPEMSDLAAEFSRFAGVAAPAKIQMCLFLGRGDTAYYSPRRPLDDIIEGGLKSL